MKIQLAYKFTGENEAELLKTLKRICSCLNEAGYETYCPALNPNRPKEKKEVFSDTFNRIKDCGILLALIKSENKSEGMLMEIGCALGLGKKILLAINQKVKSTHLRELADNVVEFEDIDDLCSKLKNLKKLI